MKKVHRFLLIAALFCLLFLVYLLLQYLYPSFFDIVIIGVFHQLLIIPVLVLAPLILLCSFVIFFRKDYRREILPILVISLINTALITSFFAFLP